MPNIRKIEIYHRRYVEQHMRIVKMPTVVDKISAIQLNQTTKMTDHRRMCSRS